MAYLKQRELLKMGFKSLGRDVQISDKASIHNADQIEIGDYSRVDDFSVLSGKIYIGRNVHIGVLCNIAGGEKGVELQDFSGLSYGCHVFSQSDDYSGKTMTNPTVPDEYKDELKERVVIGRYVIIGTQSVVFPGVVIAEGTAIGAMTLVKESTEKWSIYAGCPARRINSRKKDLLTLEKKYLNEE